jgi:hypothetical protein
LTGIAFDSIPLPDYFGSVAPANKTRQTHHSSMEILQNIKAALPLLLVVVVAVFALFLVIKIGHLILRLVFGLIGITVIVGAAWWFLLKH